MTKPNPWQVISGILQAIVAVFTSLKRSFGSDNDSADAN